MRLTAFPAAQRDIVAHRASRNVQGTGMACTAPALDLSFYAHLRVVAERRRKFLLGPDTQAHPPRKFPLDRRPTGGHQALPRPTQCRTETYYNEVRTHLSLAKDAPVPRAIRLHRAVLQSEAAAFDARLSQSRRVREAGRVSLKWCPRNRQQLKASLETKRDAVEKLAYTS